MENEKFIITGDYNKDSKMIINLLKLGYTIKQISDLFTEESYRIINILLCTNKEDIFVLDAIKKHYESYKINQNRCLVISDTHIGRLLENEGYTSYKNSINSNMILNNEIGLYNAYNYAIKNNINNIIHAGDLLEGDSNEYTRRLKYDLQLNYLMKKYPQVDGIKTYLLYGNHDYNLAYFDNVNLKKEYQKIKNMELIGLNSSYIYFNDNLVKISHYSKMSEFYSNIDLPVSFELSGHSHFFSFDDEIRLIRVPTLSSIIEDVSCIGFLELLNEENEFVFRFLDKNTNLKDEKILKKINNSYN